MKNNKDKTASNVADKTFSAKHFEYVRRIKRENVIVSFSRIALLLTLLGLWELFSAVGIIDAFIFSSPSKILVTTVSLFKEHGLLFHTFETLYKTLLGFLIAVAAGYAVALALWWSERLRRILEPYIVVLNSLPKIALGPIIIVWFGAGPKAIIFMSVLVAIVVATITMLAGFTETDKDKILLLRSMNANKMQILTKLVIPGSIPTFISMLKISVGMAWIGSIMGEYLVSKAGLGYLIVYGGQVFKLDLVMSATVILCSLAVGMYALVALIEKKIVKSGK